MSREETILTHGREAGSLAHWLRCVLSAECVCVWCCIYCPLAGVDVSSQSTHMPRAYLRVVCVGGVGQDARMVAGADLTATMVLVMAAGLMVLAVVGGSRRL